MGYQYKSMFVVVQCCGVDGCLLRAQVLEAWSPASVAVKKWDQWKISDWGRALEGENEAPSLLLPAFCFWHESRVLFCPCSSLAQKQQGQLHMR